jgi:hypothetical protein
MKQLVDDYSTINKVIAEFMKKSIEEEEHE